MPSYTAAAEGESPTKTVLPAGTYSYVVEDAVEKMSRAGNEMIELRLKVGDDDAGYGKCWEYLVFSERAAWKIDQFLASVGRPTSPGDNVEIETDDLIGLEGQAEITVGKNNKGEDRNEVGAFLAGSPTKVAPRVSNAPDNIPF